MIVVPDDKELGRIGREELLALVKSLRDERVPVPPVTVEEHNARVEEMKAAEKRVREWMKNPEIYTPDTKDVRLMLERIDAYEASITWHTDCLTCPKLLDQIYAMDQHVIPELVKKGARLLAAAKKVFDERLTLEVTDELRAAVQAYEEKETT